MSDLFADTPTNSAQNEPPKIEFEALYSERNNPTKIEPKYNTLAKAGETENKPPRDHSTEEPSTETTKTSSEPLSLVELLKDPEEVEETFKKLDLDSNYLLSGSELDIAKLTGNESEREAATTLRKYDSQLKDFFPDRLKFNKLVNERGISYCDLAAAGISVGHNYSLDPIQLDYNVKLGLGAGYGLAAGSVGGFGYKVFRDFKPPARPVARHRYWMAGMALGSALNTARVYFTSEKPAEQYQKIRTSLKEMK